MFYGRYKSHRTRQTPEAILVPFSLPKNVRTDRADTSADDGQSGFKGITVVIIIIHTSGPQVK